MLPARSTLYVSTSPPRRLSASVIRPTTTSPWPQWIRTPDMQPSVRRARTALGTTSPPAQVWGAATLVLDNRLENVVVVVGCRAWSVCPTGRGGDTAALYL